jgi:hypothetical protein
MTNNIKIASLDELTDIVQLVYSNSNRGQWKPLLFATLRNLNFENPSTQDFDIVLNRLVDLKRIKKESIYNMISEYNKIINSAKRYSNYYYKKEMDKKSAHVSVRLPLHLYNKIEKISYELNLSFSDAFRYALENILDKEIYEETN